MLFYFTFYAVIFGLVILYEKVFQKGWRDGKVTLLSLSISILLLLVWNFIAGPFLIAERASDGMPVLLRTAFSSAFLCVVALGFLAVCYIFRKLMRQF